MYHTQTSLIIGEESKHQAQSQRGPVYHPTHRVRTPHDIPQFKQTDVVLHGLLLGVHRIESRTAVICAETPVAGRRAASPPNGTSLTPRIETRCRHQMGATTTEVADHQYQHPPGHVQARGVECPVLSSPGKGGPIPSNPGPPRPHPSRSLPRKTNVTVVTGILPVTRNVYQTTANNKRQ